MARKHKDEINQLRQDTDEVTQLRQDTDEVTQLRQDTDEVTQLREDKIQLLQQLVEKDATISEKTERIHQLEMQIVKASASTTINNNYNTFLINMLEPISLDPKDPGYKECMAEFVHKLHESMNVLGDAENCDEYKYSRICRETGLDFLFNGKKARYLLTDIARRKGVYLAPDGILRTDEYQKTAAYFYNQGIYQNWITMKDRREFTDHYVRAVGKGRKNFCEKLKTDGFNLYNIMRETKKREAYIESKDPVPEIESKDDGIVVAV